MEKIKKNPASKTNDHASAQDLEKLYLKNPRFRVLGEIENILLGAIERSLKRPRFRALGKLENFLL